MREYTGNALRLDAGQPRHPRQRHVRLWLRVFRVVRHQHTRHLLLQGTTQEARFGNPTPRIADAPAGMLNAVGLQNPGVRAVIREELPKLKKVFHKKVIANVSGFSVEEYARTCALLDREEQVGLLEVNISCPNVPRRRHGLRLFAGDGRQSHRGGQGGDEKARLHEALAQRRQYRRSRARLRRSGRGRRLPHQHASGMRIDPRTRRPILANTFGGLSAPACCPWRCAWSGRCTRP